MDLTKEYKETTFLKYIRLIIFVNIHILNLQQILYEFLKQRCNLKFTNPNPFYKNIGYTFNKDGNLKEI